MKYLTCKTQRFVTGQAPKQVNKMTLIKIQYNILLSERKL